MHPGCLSIYQFFCPSSPQPLQLPNQLMKLRWFSLTSQRDDVPVGSVTTRAARGHR